MENAALHLQIAAFQITDINALPHNDMSADAFLAKDTLQSCEMQMSPFSANIVHWDHNPALS